MNTPSEAAKPFELHGVLVRAGTFPIREEEITGVVVACSRHDLEQIKRLPMMKSVSVVDAIPAKSAEAYFSDRDKFVAYVEEIVNPARRKESLPECAPGVAAHLYGVLTEARHRQ